MSVEFFNNSVKVRKKLEEALIAGLYDAGSIILSQTKQNSRVATGQTKNAWKCVVDEDKMTATIGNPEENSYWEEFGTGEYALNGKGRKGGWVYKDEKGEMHFTYGKRPNRALFSAFCSKKNTVIRAIQDKVKENVR